MKMLITQQNGEFYLYFDKIHPANLCYVSTNLKVTQAKANELLKLHNGTKGEIEYYDN